MIILGPEMDILAWAGVISLFFLLTIPFLGLIQWVFRLSWNYRWPKGISNTMIGILSFSFVIFACVLIISIKEYSHKYETNQLSTYNIPKDTLFLNMSDEKIDRDMSVHLGKLSFTHHNKNWAIKNVYFSIEKSLDDQVHVKKILHSRGRSESKAEDNALAIQTSLVFFENQISISKYLQLPIDRRFRGQRVDYVIYIPSGKTIEIDASSYSRLNSKSKLKVLEKNDKTGYIYVM